MDCVVLGVMCVNVSKLSFPFYREIFARRSVTSFYFENLETGSASFFFNCNSTRKSLNAQYGFTFRSVVVVSNSSLTQHRWRGFTACADLHDVRTRTRSRTRLRLRGGTRARGEGPGIRAVSAHRHGEAAVSEREPRRGREAGVQAVGPAKREGQGNRGTASRPRSTRLFSAAEPRGVGDCALFLYGKHNKQNTASTTPMMLMLTIIVLFN